MTAEKNEHSEKPKEPEYKIQIDRVHYSVAKREMTGLELRNLPTTPIPPERDLFEVVPGHPDRKLADQDLVELANGKRFFSAPGTINPGTRWGG